MKSSELIHIFHDGNIVIPIYFLKHFQKFQLKMDEFVFLMYLYHLGDCVFNPSKFSSELNLDLSKVMSYIDTLTEKGFIHVDVVKNDKGLMEEFILLENFFEKISLIAMEDINIQDDNNPHLNVYEMIEKEFGRTLSPMEYEIIKAWLDSHIHEDLITEAVKEATFNGVSNLRYIDKILYEWGKKGIQSVSDVEKMRKERNHKNKDDDISSEEIDTDIFDWNWFDDDE